jgi:ribosomal protein S1
MSDRPSPFEEYRIAHPPGSMVTGTVSRVAPFGVFVDLGGSVEGLLLVPYMARPGATLRYPDDFPRVGEPITARVFRYGTQGQIALSQATAATRARDGSHA